jgi:hypothetical protein
MAMNHYPQPGCGGIEVIDPHNHKSEHTDAEWAICAYLNRPVTILVSGNNRQGEP